MQSFGQLSPKNSNGSPLTSRRTSKGHQVDFKITGSPTNFHDKADQQMQETLTVVAAKNEMYDIIELGRTNQAFADVACQRSTGNRTLQKTLQDFTAINSPTNKTAGSKKSTSGYQIQSRDLEEHAIQRLVDQASNIQSVEADTDRFGYNFEVGQILGQAATSGGTSSHSSLHQVMMPIQQRKIVLNKVKIDSNHLQVKGKSPIPNKISSPRVSPLGMLHKNSPTRVHHKQAAGILVRNFDLSPVTVLAYEKEMMQKRRSGLSSITDEQQFVTQDGSLPPTAGLNDDQIIARQKNISQISLNSLPKELSVTPQEAVLQRPEKIGEIAIQASINSPTSGQGHQMFSAPSFASFGQRVNQNSYEKLPKLDLGGTESSPGLLAHVASQDSLNSLGKKSSPFKETLSSEDMTRNRILEHVLSTRTLKKKWDAMTPFEKSKIGEQYIKLLRQDINEDCSPQKRQAELSVNAKSFFGISKIKSKSKIEYKEANLPDLNILYQQMLAEIEKGKPYQQKLVADANIDEITIKKQQQKKRPESIGGGDTTPEGKKSHFEVTVHSAGGDFKFVSSRQELRNSQILSSIAREKEAGTAVRVNDDADNGKESIGSQIDIGGSDSASFEAEAVQTMLKSLDEGATLSLRQALISGQREEHGSNNQMIHSAGGTETSPWHQVGGLTQDKRNKGVRNLLNADISAATSQDARKREFLSHNQNVHLQAHNVGLPDEINPISGEYYEQPHQVRQRLLNQQHYSKETLVPPPAGSKLLEQILNPNRAQRQIYIMDTIDKASQQFGHLINETPDEITQSCFQAISLSKKREMELHQLTNQNSPKAFQSQNQLQSQDKPSTVEIYLKNSQQSLHQYDSNYLNSGSQHDGKSGPDEDDQTSHQGTQKILGTHSNSPNNRSLGRLKDQNSLTLLNSTVSSGQGDGEQPPELRMTGQPFGVKKPSYGSTATMKAELDKIFAETSIPSSRPNKLSLLHSPGKFTASSPESPQLSSSSPMKKPTIRDIIVVERQKSASRGNQGSQPEFIHIEQSNEESASRENTSHSFIKNPKLPSLKTPTDLIPQSQEASIRSSRRETITSPGHTESNSQMQHYRQDKLLAPKIPPKSKQRIHQQLRKSSRPSIKKTPTNDSSVGVNQPQFQSQLTQQISQNKTMVAANQTGQASTFQKRFQLNLQAKGTDGAIRHEIQAGEFAKELSKSQEQLVKLGKESKLESLGTQMLPSQLHDTSTNMVVPVNVQDKEKFLVQPHITLIQTKSSLFSGSRETDQNPEDTLGKMNDYIQGTKLDMGTSINMKTPLQLRSVKKQHLDIVSYDGTSIVDSMLSQNTGEDPGQRITQDRVSTDLQSKSRLSVQQRGASSLDQDMQMARISEKSSVADSKMGKTGRSTMIEGVQASLPSNSYQEGIQSQIDRPRSLITIQGEPGSGEIVVPKIADAMEVAFETFQAAKDTSELKDILATKVTDLTPFETSSNRESPSKLGHGLTTANAITGSKQLVMAQPPKQGFTDNTTKIRSVNDFLAVTLCHGQKPRGQKMMAANQAASGGGGGLGKLRVEHRKPLDKVLNSEMMEEFNRLLGNTRAPVTERAGYRPSKIETSPRPPITTRINTMSQTREMAELPEIHRPLPKAGQQILQKRKNSLPTFFTGLKSKENFIFNDINNPKTFNKNKSLVKPLFGN